MFKIILFFGLLFFLGYGVVSFFTRNFARPNNRQKATRNSSTPPQQDNKRFTEDVGEYVSYEEVKDEDSKQK